MSARFGRYLLAAMLILTASLAQATITCNNLSSTGFTAYYSPAGVVPNINQGTISFNCTRGASGDPTVVGVGMNVGQNAVGNIARAKLGANFIQYDIYNDSGCSVLLSSTSLTANIPVTLPTDFLQHSYTVSYWGCISLSGQSVPAGTYVDRISFDIQNLAGTVGYSALATFAVNIVNPATCFLTSIGNVSFGTYVAFRNTPLVSPAANVVVNCTVGLPYTMNIDSTSGVIAGVGLSYSLAKSWVNPLTGAGPGQVFTITGTLPAGQAGQCSSASCSGNDTRTLTITF